jgi:hypothetical protein
LTSGVVAMRLYAATCSHMQLVAATPLNLAVPAWPAGVRGTDLGR